MPTDRTIEELSAMADEYQEQVSALNDKADKLRAEGLTVELGVYKHVRLQIGEADALMAKVSKRL